MITTEQTTGSPARQTEVEPQKDVISNLFLSDLPAYNGAMTSLGAQLVKNPPAMQKTPVHPWVGKIPWRRDRLPTPVFLGFLVKNLPAVKETWV